MSKTYRQTKTEDRQSRRQLRLREERETRVRRVSFLSTVRVEGRVA